jgi:hypothetical protein
MKIVAFNAFRWAAFGADCTGLERCYGTIVHRGRVTICKAPLKEAA